MAYPKLNKTYQTLGYNLTPCSNRRKNKAVKYVVVHYTGTTASAKNNCIYFRNGNRNASADYFIDTNGDIYKYNQNCASRYSWHCGDGYGKYGITNYNSIGIEVVSAGAEYTAAQKKSLAALVQAIQADYSVPDSRVVRHYEASRKVCPKPYAGTNAKNKKWQELHALITGNKKAVWIKNTNGKWWYKHADGSYTVNDWEKINGDWYYFDSKGYAVTGWKKVANKWYYFAYKNDRKFKECAMYHDCSLVENGKTYNFGSDGAMLTGFQSYKVMIDCDTLNVRKGPGVEYVIATTVREGEVFTITEEKTTAGTRWGKLKSGAGWVSLAYTKKL